MFQGSGIFEKHYHDYCGQIAKVDFASIKDKLAIGYENDRVLISFFNKDYIISNTDITDASGRRPEYMVCVILAKYILSCPDRLHIGTEWVSFKDFKRESQFTNANLFTSDTENVLIKHFSGKIDALFDACESLGGFRHEEGMPYDLSMQFTALPRISLLLLFNDGDEEFSATCTILLQNNAESYLDPESLAMTSVFLAKNLVRSLSLIESKRGELVRD